MASVVTEAAACRQGYVWREASGPNDIVCVTPVERSISAVQNQGYPNDSCTFGLVWREAGIEFTDSTESLPRLEAFGKTARTDAVELVRGASKRTFGEMLKPGRCHVRK